MPDFKSDRANSVLNCILDTSAVCNGWRLTSVTNVAPKHRRPPLRGSFYEECHWQEVIFATIHLGYGSFKLLLR